MSSERSLRKPQSWLSTEKKHRLPEGKMEFCWWFRPWINCQHNLKVKCGDYYILRFIMSVPFGGGISIRFPLQKMSHAHVPPLFLCSTNLLFKNSPSSLLHLGGRSIGFLCQMRFLLYYSYTMLYNWLAIPVGNEGPCRVPLLPGILGMKLLPSFPTSRAS